MDSAHYTGSATMFASACGLFLMQSCSFGTRSGVCATNGINTMVEDSPVAARVMTAHSLPPG